MTRSDQENPPTMNRRFAALIATILLSAGLVAVTSDPAAPCNGGECTTPTSTTSTSTTTTPVTTTSSTTSTTTTSTTSTTTTTTTAPVAVPPGISAAVPAAPAEVVPRFAG